MEEMPRKEYTNRRNDIPNTPMEDFYHHITVNIFITKENRN